MTRLEIGGTGDLRRLLATAAAHGPTKVSTADAARLTAAYRGLGRNAGKLNATALSTTPGWPSGAPGLAEDCSLPAPHPKHAA